VSQNILTPAEVAVLETFVVPRYLSAFGTAAMDMMLTGGGANVVHLGCRTGYPDAELLAKIPNCQVVGVDPSAAAIELARNKAASYGRRGLSYSVASGYPTELPSASFSHAMSLHPIANMGGRAELFAELMRLTYAAGQVLVSMPLRGSFQELGDLFKEYALKYDEGEFGQAVEVAMGLRPSIETLAEELERVGLSDVDVEVVSTELKFAGGRAFIEDPTTRLLIVPDLETLLGNFDLASPLTYVCDAIDEYWSETEFSLSVKVGCASARRR
jgi:ubiquinone/menaquinone biosynthesis C-methylase UbiE